LEVAARVVRVAEVGNLEVAANLSLFPNLEVAANLRICPNSTRAISWKIRGNVWTDVNETREFDGNDNAWEACAFGNGRR
jgi:hypothetical protein